MLKRIAHGDNDAFKKLYIETKRGVYAFLYTYFNNQIDCEDVMQTVYLKIKTNISKYKEGTNGLAWILQIAKNTALNEIRSKSNYQNLKGTEKADVNSFDNVLLKGSLMSAMKQVLSEEEQRIIILHVIWSYKHKEISEILDCPIGTVTSKYKRAIEKLKTALKGVE